MGAIQTLEIGASRRRGRPPGSRSKPSEDVRFVFDRLSDDALLDDNQVALLAGRAVSTIKRWRAEGVTPPVVKLHELPRYRAGDIRAWLRGGAPVAAGLTPCATSKVLSPAPMGA
jgi:predicted DNA-binding transcriptional regulator AlpA